MMDVIIMRTQGPQIVTNVKKGREDSWALQATHQRNIFELVTSANSKIRVQFQIAAASGAGAGIRTSKMLSLLTYLCWKR